MNIKSTTAVVSAAVISVIIVVFAMGIMAVGHVSYRNSLDTQSRAMENAVAATLSGLDDFIANSEFLARTVALAPSVRRLLQDGEDHDAVQAMLDAMLRDSRSHWALFVFDGQGAIVAGSNAKGQDLTGADRSGRDYVQAIAAGQDAYLGRRILTAKSGDGLPIAAVAHAVRDASGAVLGGVGLFPNWRTVTEKYIDPVRIGESGYGFITDDRGILLAHVDSALVLDETRPVAPFVRQALSKGDGEFTYDWEGRDKRMIFRTFDKTGWMVAMSAYEDDLASTAIAQRNMLILGGGLCALVVIAVLVLSFRTLIRAPLSAMLGYVHEIGRGNYQARLEGRFRHEMLELADGLRSMVGQLKDKLGFAQGLLDNLPVATVVSDLNGRVAFVNPPILELAGHDDDPGRHMGDHVGQFFYGDASRRAITHDALERRKCLTEMERTLINRRNEERTVRIDAAPLFDLDGVLTGAFAMLTDLTLIKRQQRDIEAQNGKIAKVAKSAADIASRVASASEELSAQVEQSSMGAEQQRQRSTETATAMEEMNASIMEVARNASSGAENAAQAMDKARQGEDVVKSVEDSIGQLQEGILGLRESMADLGVRAEGVGAIMNVISDIADQTNLLALNAAIEAARAGDAGRGFAVVADEVRKLAEKTMAATKEVGQAIGAIQEGTFESVRKTEQAAQSVTASTDLARRAETLLHEIVTMASRTSDQVRVIATAAEQQSAASEEVSRGAEDISRISGETSDAMRQSSEAVQGLARLASRLNELMASMNGGA